MNDHQKRKRPLKNLVVIVVLTLLGGTAAYIFSYHDPAQALERYLQQIHPLVFLSAMAILPIVGAPISLFLVLVGIEFGIATGIAVTALLMAFHMAISYYLANSFLYKWLSALLRLLNITMPRFVGRFSKRTAFIFMLIPGLPYVVKNNVLALSKMDFIPYMLINWTAQFAMSIPLIIAGKAVLDMNVTILAAAATLLLLCYLVQYLAKRRYKPPPDG